MSDSGQVPTYLIIGGTTKAATTSVYSYLADHPEICGASLKETRYFLDPSHPTPIPRSYSQEGKEGYVRYFKNCLDRPVRMEATPDYLYSKLTPTLLKRVLPKVRCVFILRDPVDRLRSWYRFARQNGQISHAVSFDEYVRRQLDDEEPNDEQPWRALEEGKYAQYLRRYVDVLGREAVLVLYFEHLVDDLEQHVKRIARFVGVSPTFYSDYAFDVHNETRSIRYPRVHAAYLQILRAVRYRVHKFPRIHDILKKVRSKIDSIYFKLLAKEEKIKLESGKEKRLKKEYYRDIEKVEKLVGKKSPWKQSE